MLGDIEQFFTRDKKFKNMPLILNGTRRLRAAATATTIAMNGYHYGYGYGYLTTAPTRMGVQKNRKVENWLKE